MICCGQQQPKLLSNQDTNAQIRELRTMANWSEIEWLPCAVRSTLAASLAPVIPADRGGRGWAWRLRLRMGPSLNVVHSCMYMDSDSAMKDNVRVLEVGASGTNRIHRIQGYSAGTIMTVLSCRGFWIRA